MFCVQLFSFRDRRCCRSVTSVAFLRLLGVYSEHTTWRATTKKTQQPTKHHYQKAAGRPLYRSPFTRGAADGAPFFNPFDT